MPTLTLPNLAVYSVHVALIVAAGGLLCRLVRLRAPGARLAFYRSLLALCLALPLLAPLRPPRAERQHLEAGVAAGTASSEASLHAGGPASPSPAAPAALPGAAAGALPLLLAGGVLARLAWLGAGLLALRRLRRDGIPASTSPAFEWAEDRTGARAEVRLSPAIGLPATYGVRRPIVLLPPAFATWPEATQRALASHELIHVGRRDWMHALSEELVKACFWFHPAIWWLVDRIHLAREQVVDRQVVAITGDRAAYLRDLLGLAAAHATAAPARAAAFFRRPHLLQRVDVLLKEGPMSRTRLVVSFVAAALALATATAATLRALPLEAVFVSRPTQADASKPPVLAAVQADARKQPLPPAPVTKVPVDYPEAARAAGVEGPVVLQVSTDTGGTPTDVQVALGAPELTDAAITALWRWRFEPSEQPSTFVIGVNVRPDVPEPGPGQEARRISGELKPPTKTFDVRPAYPREAMEARVQGLVIIEAVIGIDGHVATGRVLRSLDPRLDVAALDAVLRWRYAPSTHDGRPVPILMTVTINFALQ